MIRKSKTLFTAFPCFPLYFGVINAVVNAQSVSVGVLEPAEHRSFLGFPLWDSGSQTKQT